MDSVGLKCLNCQKEYPLDEMFEGCPECKEEGFRSNLVVIYDLDNLRQYLTRPKIEERGGQWIYKYKELLPVVTDKELVTLGEGETKLLKCNNLARKLELSNLYIKDESGNPTGSFKDRIACIGTAVAKQKGFRNIVAGGGNMATAAAAYASKYNLNVISFETAVESYEALLQTLLFGGKVIPLKRYEDRYYLMKKCVQEYNCYPLSSYTPSPATDPYSQEGSKTIAFEICQDLGWKSPDIVIVPTGQGFCLGGVWQGFQEFYKIGLVDHLPTMVAAESSAGGSFTKTLKRGSETILPVETGETVARHAIAPQGSYKGFKALKDSNGFAIQLSDREVIEAVKLLAQEEGVFASTTSATALAALRKIRSEGKNNLADMEIVLVITAIGTKDIDILSDRIDRIPEQIGSDWDGFISILDQRYNFEL